MATTRGKLSPATPLLLLTTPLVDTATTSTVPATPTLIGLPRVFTRGPPTATPLPSLTTPLEAMATASTALATPTPTGLPRVFTRGRPLALATSRLSVATATDTTARTPSMVLRLTATMPRSTRLVMATTLPTTTDSTTKAL